MGNTFWGSTPAFSQSFFIAAHILLRFKARFPLVIKTGPSAIRCFFIYSFKIRRSFSGRKTMRFLFLQLTSARPVFTASAVINASSDTRIPVAQMVCITSFRRSFPCLCASPIRRIYSSRDNPPPVPCRSASAAGRFYSQFLPATEIKIFV